MKHERRLVSIALPAEPRGLYEEFGAMMLDVLQDSPYDAFLVGDGEMSALDADILLMAGDCLSFEAYADIFGKHRGERPETIFWMYDTLPPAALDDRSARVASRLRFYEHSLLWLRTHMKPVVSTIPIGVRRKLGLQACSTLMREFRRDAESLHPAVRELDVNSWYEIFGRYEWFSRNIPKGWLDHLVVSTKPKQDFLRTMGIDPHLVPVGCHPIMGEDLGRERDIDVLFVGELDYGRRSAIVEAIEVRLRSMGKSVTIVRGSCYGRERTELFNRAKLSLNIPRFPWDIPTIRFFISMACGTMAISEDMGSTWPIEAGKHFATAGASDLPDLIAHYLSHEDERLAITRAATELITTDRTMANSLLRVLDLCRTADKGKVESTK